MRGAMTTAARPDLPRRLPRPAPRRGLTISYSPDVLLTFVAFFGLAFVPMLGSKGALLFLMAGMVLALSRPGETLASLRREWLLVLVAIWCVMSFAWSDYTSLTLRHGIQLCLTVAIAVVIGYRIAPLALVKLVFVTMTLAGVASLLSGRTRADGGGYLGIYASKNALAGEMSILVIVALAVLIDRRMPARWRLPALFSLGLGAMLMLMGNSAGALVSTLGVIMVFGAILLLQRMTPHLRLVVLAMTAVLFAAVVVLASSMTDQLAKAFLDLTGKDITLTGRTDLWAVALAQIAERPLLGVGFQAFWVHGQPMAEQLWAEFGIKSRGGFNFHNTPLSNAVEIGIPATLVQTAIVLAAFGSSLGWAIRRPSAASVFFALFMTRIFLLMWIEVVYFYQFAGMTMIIVVAVCYGRRFREAERLAALKPPSARPGRAGLPAIPRAATYAAAARSSRSR